MINPEQLAACGSESGHQKALFAWAALNLNKYPDTKWLFAIPNGGQRGIITASRMKAEGLKAGVPDICLPVNRGNWAALWIELKRPQSSNKKKGSVQSIQEQWINHLTKNYMPVIVCYGWQHARSEIIKYLNGEMR